MAKAFMKMGQILSLDGRIYRIDRDIGNKEWQLEDSETGRYIARKESELLEMLESGALYFHSPDAQGRRSTSNGAERGGRALDSLADAEREAATVRYEYVMAVKRAALSSFTEKSLRPVILATWESIKKPASPPSWSSVNRWRKSFYTAGEDVAPLIDNTRAMGNRSRRLSPRMLELVQQAIQEIYMTREQGTIQDTISRAVSLCASENKRLPTPHHLPLPTRSLIKREISRIPAIDRMLARHGRQVTTHKLRSATGTVVTERPLARAEIDHTKLDIIVVDETTYLPLGRPTLTVCIDHFSRCVLGIYVGFEPPGWSAVTQCLKHAVLPKTYLGTQYPDIKGSWDCHGVMESLVVDHGLEFHSHGLESTAFSFGIDIQFMPRKTPWFKGTVERFIGTMNRAVAHGHPGTTFGNILSKEDYDAAKNATITLASLKEIIHLWIVDIYHQARHRILKRKPADAWKEHWDYHPIPLPDNANNLDALIGTQVTREVTHKGVELNSLFYNSQELASVRRRLGEQFKTTIRFNPADLGQVHVTDPKTNRLITVPALRIEYAKGLSLWQHDVCRNFARERMNRTDIEAVAEAKRKIAEIVARDMEDKRVGTRGKGKRFTGDAPPQPTQPQTSPESATPTNPDSPDATSPDISQAQPVEPARKRRIMEILT